MGRRSKAAREGNRGSWAPLSAGAMEISCAPTAQRGAARQALALIVEARRGREAVLWRGSRGMVGWEIAARDAKRVWVIVAGRRQRQREERHRSGGAQRHDVLMTDC